MTHTIKKPRILLIIPCYNEQDTIASLLEEINACNMGYETVVVDDGSCDATWHIASQISPTVRLLQNLGIGGAVQTGIKYAERNGFDFCVQIDGDGQHPPSEIVKLLEAYGEVPHSITVGSRYILYDAFQSTWSRRCGSKTISWTLNTLFSTCQVSDPTSGMRLMDHKAIKLFAKYYPFDFPEPISLAWALNEGLSVGEVAVKMRERTHGNSSIIGFKTIAYMLRVLGYIVLARITHSFAWRGR